MGLKNPSVTSERVSSKPSDCCDSGESFDAHIEGVCMIFEKGRGFCRAPCLAVGLLYTCILQGARQAQGPCCTNLLQLESTNISLQGLKMTVLAFFYFHILWCVLLQCFLFSEKSTGLKNVQI